MKILYGVQATGQGHISRARAMARALAAHDVEVTWLFSGRPRDRLFDMAPFGDYAYRRGLTFATREGRIRYMATLRDSKPFEFLRDIRELELAPYQLIITDYEPVTAWAARLQGRSTIGIGHQYAFGASTPQAGGDRLSRVVMRNFAPVDRALGLHWHPYAENVLPPILDLPDLPRAQSDHILVYLPFEDQDRVSDWLSSASQQHFVQYANGLQYGVRGNVERHPASIDGFKQHLASCAGVICNSGFELVSECIQWRKPVLTRPLAGQMEQLSNALALRQLGLATTTDELSVEVLGDWLRAPGLQLQRQFGDVAGAIAAWIADDCREPVNLLGRRLWADLEPVSTLRNSPSILRSSIPNHRGEALAS